MTIKISGTNTGDAKIIMTATGKNIPEDLMSIPKINNVRAINKTVTIA